MKKLWSVILNVFLNVTKSNYKKMLNMAGYHDSALYGEKSDSFILTLYNRFHNLFVLYAEKYENWTTVRGIAKGETNRIKSFFKQFSQKLRQWDAKVQVVYLEKTSEYLAIFPTGKRNFYIGSYQDRLNEMASLIGRLQDITPLATLQAEIQAFYDVVRVELTEHQAKQTAIKNASEELDHARLATGNMMYANLGLLMDHFFEDIEQIERFYPVSSIRRLNNNGESSDDNIYTIGIKALERKEAGISFGAETIFSVYNNGEATIGLYTAGSIDAPAVSPVVTLQAEEIREINAFELGNVNNRYMFIVNLSDNEDTEVEISIV